MKKIDENSDLLLSGPAFWTRKDRLQAYKQLRDEAPISFHPEVPTPWAPEGGTGFWAVTLHEDVLAVTRNPKVFSSRFGTSPEDWPEARNRALGMLHMDGAEHRMWRAMVGPAFAPRYLDALIDSMRANADDVIDAFLAETEVDIVQKLVKTYPVRVIADMLAMPKEDHEKFIEWTILAFGTDRVKGNAAHYELIQYGTNLAATRRANVSDDVMSRIVTAQVDGRLLTDNEVGGFVSLLIGAGAETTGATLATGIYELAKNPDQWKLLKEDPNLIKSAIDEFCRYASAVINFRRNANEDIEMRGQKIKAGDKVVMYYESANFDERVFPNPEKFEITRDAKKHVSFGAGGIHQCLGEFLARKEMQVFLEQFVKRIDKITIIKDKMLSPNHRFNMVKELTATFNG